MAPLQKLLQSADHSWLQQLSADPETEKSAPNKTSRQVRSGHYVRVLPTPLPRPKLIIHSPDMAAALGVSDSECTSQEFAAFFSGQQAVANGSLESWCTPYALSIMGERMVRNCPFGNGNGYGDGRAVSVGEVVVSGRRWELQLKGGGTTPFCRGADGRAVLRSSVREFLASEAMHNLGVETTRALSLVVSDKGGETTQRPWYSARNKSDDPDMMVEEACAITTRVATSFLRVGHVDLFAKRAVGRTATKEQQLELKQMVEHALFREYADCLPGAPLAERAVAMLDEAAGRFARLAAGWLRVGFCQGNFNADNCLVGGRTMDYGPFGFMEKYDPFFAKWTGSGRHFAFINQPQAALANYYVFVDSVAPVLGEDAGEITRAVKARAAAQMKAAVADMWRTKMGFSETCSLAAEALWEELERLMRRSDVDYTILFRQLAAVAEVASEEETSGVQPLSPTPGAQVRAKDLVGAAQLNGLFGTCLQFVADSGRWAVAMESGEEKALKPENLEVRATGDQLLRPILAAFYVQPSEELKARWLHWLRVWRSALALESAGGGPAAAAARMRSANPKFIPREWMLIQAYDAAAKGDYGSVQELFKLFLTPYDEHPELEAKYFCKTPPEYQKKGG
ncbi:unnamed protein product, partial [Polarella glacialis]